MQAPGYWGNHVWQPNYWPDDYWYEIEPASGEPYRIFYAQRAFIFKAMKLYTFPSKVRDFIFSAVKRYIYPVREHEYIFEADKHYIFQAAGGMTNPSYFEKMQGETFTIAVEFANQLPFSASISSGTIAARKMDDLSDATGIVLSSPTATVSGTQLRGKVTSGKPGVKYRLLFTATLNNGEILQEGVYMQIREA